MQYDIDRWNRIIKRYTLMPILKEQTAIRKSGNKQHQTEKPKGKMWQHNPLPTCRKVYSHLSISKIEVSLKSNQFMRQHHHLLAYYRSSEIKHHFTAAAVSITCEKLLLQHCEKHSNPFIQRLLHQSIWLYHKARIIEPPPPFLKSLRPYSIAGQIAPVERVHCP